MGIKFPTGNSALHVRPDADSWTGEVRGQKKIFIFCIHTWIPHEILSILSMHTWGKKRKFTIHCMLEKKIFRCLWRQILPSVDWTC